jgi:hypothetical protein
MHRSVSQNGEDSFSLRVAVLNLLLRKMLLLPPLQVSNQVGIRGDTENKRSSSDCAYQFCFKGVKRLADMVRSL